MRSRKEIAFRLRQEIANLWLLARPPVVVTLPQAPLAGLPHPEPIASVLRGTAFAAELERLAGLIVQHRFPLLGREIDTGPQIAWRRDPHSGRETAPRYFRWIPYLNFQRAGDHKLIWELNRHQHLVLLAQAFCCSSREEYRRELFAQLESWWEQNPFQRGINWSSALEVAFRALSWIWIYHLTGDRMPEPFRRRFLIELYRHGCHLEHNLSVYFSPNTHLLGEAVALHALGKLFPDFPRAARWKQRGSQLVAEQINRQVRQDGSHFEQSSYYHVYALDFFLFHYLIDDRRPEYREKLAHMAGFLTALVGSAGLLPFLGDDDGGRLFYPYGAREKFARATLATCAAVLGSKGLAHYCPEDIYEQALWWVGPDALRVCAAAYQTVPQSQYFPDAGLAILHADDVEAIVDAGPFGSGSAGHSHSDTLSIILRRGGQDILIDPGTYTYVTDPEWRDWFRGSAAHNTVRVDGRDQGVPAGPFRWAKRPVVRMKESFFGAEKDYIEAVCEYGGIRHIRKILFQKPRLLLILDEIHAEGEHEVEQFWHLAEPGLALSPRSFRIGKSAVLALAGFDTIELSQGGQHGWRSPAPGLKLPAPVIRASRRCALPLRAAAALCLDDVAEPLEIELLEPALVRIRGRFTREIRIVPGNEGPDLDRATMAC